MHNFRGPRTSARRLFQGLAMGPITFVDPQRHESALERDPRESFAYSGVQPITGLWGVYEGHRALSYGEDAARHGRRATRNDVIRAVADAYFQALAADKFAEIAEVSVRQIEAHVERARSFHRHDLIGDDKDGVCNDNCECEVRLLCSPSTSTCAPHSHARAR